MDENNAQEIFISLIQTAMLKLNEGHSYDTVLNELIELGLSQEVAESIAQKAADDLYDHLTSKANKNLAFGSLWFFGGLLVTLVTYSGGGSRYIIAYGAIIGGLIQLCIGIFKRPSRYY